MKENQTNGLTRSDLLDLYHWFDNNWLFLDPSMGLDDCEIADVDDLRAKLAGMPTEVAGPLMHDAIKLVERQRTEYADWSKRYALPDKDAEPITAPIQVLTEEDEAEIDKVTEEHLAESLNRKSGRTH